MKKRFEEQTQNTTGERQRLQLGGRYGLGLCVMVQVLHLEFWVLPPRKPKPQKGCMKMLWILC